MVHIFAALLATSSLLVMLTPRMPLYQVTSLKFKKIKISFLNYLSISTEILAGVQIENANFVGADLHATIIDIYYPDWNGEVRHIGTLKETPVSNSDNKNSQNINNNGGTECIQNNGEWKKEKEDDHGICLPDVNTNTSNDTDNKHPSSSPFFTILPRGTSISKSDAVTIFVNELNPRIYLNFIKDAIMSLGSLQISVSGVAHVKTPLGVPLSLGILCDNTINLLQMPIQIVGKGCLVHSISTGWSGLTEFSAEVREHTMEILKEQGSVLFQEQNENERDEVEKDNDGMNPFLSSTEIILDWHDF